MPKAAATSLRTILKTKTSFGINLKSLCPPKDRAAATPLRTILKKKKQVLELTYRSLCPSKDRAAATPPRTILKMKIRFEIYP
jgi:hypothetical protein